MRSSGSNGVCEWEAETTEQGTRVMVRLTIPKPRFNLLNYNLDPLDGSVGVDRGNGQCADPGYGFDCRNPSSVGLGAN